MSARGITAQELAENQDASVRHTINEQTGEVTPWPAPAEEAPKPRRGRPPKVAEEERDEPAAEGEGE